MEEKKQILTCQHCGHVWNYKGNRPYTICPTCRYNVKNIHYSEQEINLLHFNLHEAGVRILDPSLATKYSPHGRIIDIYFKEGKAFCEHCESSDCKHVQYALSLPLVQKIFKKKGWVI